jgi:hypothetical protein
LSDTDNWFIRSTTAVTADMTSVFALKASFTYLYDNVPGAEGPARRLLREDRSHLFRGSGREVLRLLRRQAARARPLFGGACRKATIAITIAASAWSVPALAPAAGFRIFHSTALLEHPVGARTVEEFTLGPCCSRDLAADPPLWEVAHFDFPIIGAAPTAAAAPSPTVRFDLTQQPKRFAIGALSGVAILGSFLNAYTDGNRYDFHFTEEGYFGGTPTSAARTSLPFRLLLRRRAADDRHLRSLRLPGESSYRLASATSDLAGLATELGDGMNKYGFSYEDFVIDTAGAASAWALAHYRLDDMIGFRFGVVPAPETPEELEVNGTGKDYTGRSTRPTSSWRAWRAGSISASGPRASCSSP